MVRGESPGPAPAAHRAARAATGGSPGRVDELPRPEAFAQEGCPERWEGALTTQPAASDQHAAISLVDEVAGRQRGSGPVRSLSHEVARPGALPRSRSIVGEFRQDPGRCCKGVGRSRPALDQAVVVRGDARRSGLPWQVYWEILVSGDGFLVQNQLPDSEEQLDFFKEHVPKVDFRWIRI